MYKYYLNFFGLFPKWFSSLSPSRTSLTNLSWTHSRLGLRILDRHPLLGFSFTIWRYFYFSRFLPLYLSLKLWIGPELGFILRLCLLCCHVERSVTCVRYAYLFWPVRGRWVSLPLYWNFEHYEESGLFDAAAFGSCYWHPSPHLALSASIIARFALPVFPYTVFLISNRKKNTQRAGAQMLWSLLFIRHCCLPALSLPWSLPSRPHFSSTYYSFILTSNFSRHFFSR